MREDTVKSVCALIGHGGSWDQNQRLREAKRAVRRMFKRIAALEAALAMAEKPVAWEWRDSFGAVDRIASMDLDEKHRSWGWTSRPLFEGWHHDLLPTVRAEKPESEAVRDVLAERCRQVDAEGWTPEHDDAHEAGELLDAAICYAHRRREEQMFGKFVATAPAAWPWERSWFKPTDRRRDLVKSGALIIAEIERLDRASLANEPASQGCALPTEQCPRCQGGGGYSKAEDGAPMGVCYTCGGVGIVLKHRPFFADGP